MQSRLPLLGFVALLAVTGSGLIVSAPIQSVNGSAQQPPPKPAPRDLKYENTEGNPAQQVKVEIPRSYALVVGISHYENLPTQAQLKFPEDDANDIYTALISPEGGQFPAENVHRLIGSQATLANIRHELEDWLPSVSKDDDRVLIYFAGHGFVWQGHGYLAPYDVDPAHIDSSAYPMDTLSEVFGAKIHAKWRVLLTDACHSGAILPAADPQAVNDSLKNLNPSVFSLTASRDRERSFESPRWGGGHGVFTYYVIKGMQGEADTSGDGAVTADELAEYVHVNVRTDTNQLQNPTSDRGSFDSNMILAYNPTHVRAANPDKPTVGRLVIESNMDGVEIFVDGQSEGVVSKDKPLPLPGIMPGVHVIRGVHMGYEPYGPVQETVYPGQDTTVSVKILFPRRKNSAAVEQYEQGLKYYTDGGQNNYKKAAAALENALRLDPTYSQAALTLGQTYNAMFDNEKGDFYFKKAIEIDPDFLEAHKSYAQVLLDTGNFDEAIRHLNVVVQRDPSNADAHYLMAAAFADKDAYPEAIKESTMAIKLAPAHAEAHFWLAHSLRMTSQYDPAEREYLQYVKLSNFQSGVGGKISYYGLGFLIGFGKKTRAAQSDIWRDLHSEAYSGLCFCERRQKHFDNAIHYCETALTYDANDPFTNFHLASALIEKFNSTKDLGLLVPARQHFNSVVSYNAETEMASDAKKNVANINALFARLSLTPTAQRQ